MAPLKQISGHMGDKRTGEILKTRFATIPEWILTQPEILASPTALVVYGHLFKLGDFKTRITTSDWHEIVQSTGYSKPTVMRAMKVLRECGAAVREGENVRLPMDDPGLKYETEPGDQSQIRDKSVSNMRPAPLFTENSELASSPPPFDRFYAVYPKHVGKEDARKAFAKALKKATAETIIAGAERYRDDPTRKPEFTAHPATWLNAGRWDDEYMVAAPVQQARRW